MPSFTDRLGAALKSLVMQHPGSGGSASWSSLLLPSAQINYRKAVGDGTDNSAVMAVVLWIMRTWPEAVLKAYKLQPADDTRDVIPNHPMIRLINRPNPFFSGEKLWQAILVDFVTGGNGYWRKIRTQAGNPVELWWLPASTVEPRWPKGDPSVYISHYDYQPDVRLEPIRIPPQDIVHFRFGLDPHNTRKGLSPLGSLLREIFTDDEAASFTAALLKNLGIPGVIISPSGERNYSEDEARVIKRTFSENFTDERRGEAMVTGKATDVRVLSWSPQQLNMRDLRRIPEERVTSVLGVPAMVVGLGAGLDRSTFSNYHEAREAGYEQNIIPTQRSLASDLEIQLLPDFVGPPELEQTVLEFDNSDVRVLQPDLDKLFARNNGAVEAGWMEVAEARSDAGLPVEDHHRIFMRRINMLEIPAGESTAEREARLTPDLTERGYGPYDRLQAIYVDQHRHPIAYAALPAETKLHGHDHDLTGVAERLAVEGKASQAQSRLVVQFARLHDQHWPPFADDLSDAYRELGADVERRILDLVAAGTEREERAARPDDLQTKAADWPADLTAIANRELPADVLLPPNPGEKWFRPIYQEQYAVIAESVYGTIESSLALGISWSLDDPVARDLISQGGTRLGLVDLDAQTRDALFNGLAEAQERGLGPRQAARTVRSHVEGRTMYPGVHQRAYDRARDRGLGHAAAERAGDKAARQYRAEVIARTEAKHAQNISSIAAYRESGMIESVLIFDGADCGWTSHDDGDLANGTVRTLNDFEQNTLAHPQCVRSGAPIVTPRRLQSGDGDQTGGGSA